VIGSDVVNHVTLQKNCRLPPPRKRRYSDGRLPLFLRR
jgi:hypothetical protein